ncbi:MAG: hypothetical protein PHS02_01665 [Candidatus ainarchaeum sp.]|nr:hypothetical protein [Candidatus ainarchaeum sp.]
MNKLILDSLVSVHFLGRAKDYFRAREIARKNGMRLLKEVMHEEILVYSDLWKSLAAIYKLVPYPSVADELLVYPERFGSFKKDVDVVDWFESTYGAKPAKLPASYLSDPKYFSADSDYNRIFRIRAGLLVTPSEVEETPSHMVVHVDPAMPIRIIYPFLQRLEVGCADPRTGIPCFYPLNTLDSLDETELRLLQRTQGPGVHPIVRDTENHFEGTTLDWRRVLSYYRTRESGYGILAYDPRSEPIS